MRHWALLFLLLLPATAPAALLPGDAGRGQALHGRYCTGCHDSGVYARPNRTVKTVEGLIGRVKLCNQQLGTKLQRDQLNDLVKYLDEAFYKFP